MTPLFVHGIVEWVITISCSKKQERAMDQQQIRNSKVIWNGDKNPGITDVVNGDELHFVLIPDPPGLLDENEFTKG